MGTRVVYDPKERIAVMYDSVTGAAFGPIIEATDAHPDPYEFVDDFLTRCAADGIDPRGMGHAPLVDLLAAFGDGRESRWRHAAQAARLRRRSVLGRL